MPRLVNTCATVLILVVLGHGVSAQNKHLSIDDIYDAARRVNFSGAPPTGLKWLKDGNHYLETRRDPAAETARLVKVQAITGSTRPFHDAAKMEAAFKAVPGVSAEDAKKIAALGTVQLNSAETSVLINHRNDLFFYLLGSDTAVRLTNNPDPETGEEFSPDGRMVSFVRNHNLFVVEVATGRERALTSDGGPKVLNGRLDWVYQEELYGRGNFKGHWWSPDSNRIAFLRLDEHQVKDFVLVDHIPRLQDTEVSPYPKAGDPNPAVQLGVASAAGGEIIWVDIFKYQAADPLIVRVGWTPDSGRVVYQIQNREQTWLDLNRADPVTGESTTLLKEKSEAWVGVNEEAYWLKDGSFLWLSERSGWTHVYHYKGDGTPVQQVTDGKWEVRSLHGVDEPAGLLYFSGTEKSPIESHAYRIKLDGTGLTRLTRTEGNHAVNFSPALNLYIDTWSDLSTPAQVRLHKSDGGLARVIDENRVRVLDEYRLGKPELLQVKTRDGFAMEALIIRPPDFDPAKRYPVLTYIYGGPQAPAVRNAWGGPTYLWHQMLAQKGYIIWICDNRTASGKGIESTRPVYRNFGELELKDLEDGIAWLKSQPYVDGSRIGIWGWSYGGFMTLYALTHSKNFRMGIAGGSVTDWRLYDTIYTERYMAMPQNNPDGYFKSSPVHRAKELHGKVLLIHGMMDDNVHMQNTIQFAYELQKAEKQFELMLYPRSRHGIVDPLLVKHMRTAMTDFILANL